MCENYNGISLLNKVYKVFSVTWFPRIQPIAETSIGNYQFEFSLRKSSSDHLHSDEYWKREYGANTCYMFVDSKAVYDSTDRTGLSETKKGLR